MIGGRAMTLPAIKTNNRTTSTRRRHGPQRRRCFPNRLLNEDMEKILSQSNLNQNAAPSSLQQDYIIEVFRMTKPAA